MMKFWPSLVVTEAMRRLVACLRALQRVIEYSKAHPEVLGLAHLRVQWEPWQAALEAHYWHTEYIYGP